MSAPSSGSSPATFEIKSANLPLVALRLMSTDLQAVAHDLARQYGDVPDFFDQDPLVIDLAYLPHDAPAVDFSALVALLRRYRVAPVAFKGGGAAQVKNALEAGLVAAPDVVQARAVAIEAPAPVSAPAPASASVPAVLPAMVVDKPLRSGQQVYARGRDLVVLAMVNSGAEVIADGHIHVYAPLRGKAIAGARGNTEARIFALHLEPELLSIAGIYRASENSISSEFWGQPTQVRLVAGADGDKLVMERIKS
jgi:septum site-determining protein MinC